MKPISIWEGTGNSYSAFPSLNKPIDADIVIIGGGITGITAAQLLSAAGKKVVVLEAFQIGLGTTGNSTGNLYATVDEHLSHIKKKWNVDVMKTVVKSRNKAIDWIESSVKKHKIACDFKRVPFSHFAEKLNSNIEDFIKDEADALSEAGLKTKITDNPGLPFEIKKAITVEGQAQFHPLNYVRGLATAISDQCEIYENTKVIDIDEKTGLIKTLRGSVKAEHIIMATHTPKGVYMVQTLLGPYREHGVAAQLNSGICPEGIFWGLEQPKHSVRAFNNGDKNFVMVIGDKYKTGQNDNNIEYIQKLETYLRERFNTGAQKYVWAGQQYRPADGLPYIGKHDKNIYFITGLATDGLTYGVLGAMIVADQILGKENPFEKTFKADRFTPVKSSTTFIKENADVFWEYLKDWTWNVDAETLRGIQPGQAKIVEKDKEKLAVYKDEKGENHIVSAVCTHMKCIVLWNPAEKSWDCPCHGSRFSPDGEVIEGPAVVNLPRKEK